jgi:hypothetical protein
MRRRSLSCVALVGAALVVGDVQSSAPADAGATPALIEATACARATPLPSTDVGRTSGDTVVSFAVTGETRLRLDAGGKVTAASTNTGCRPGRAGRMVVLGDDGGRREARATEVAAALTGFRSGDWRAPGVWHDRD